MDEKGNEFIWVPVEKLSRYDFDQQKEVEKNQPINRIFYGEERKESITYHSEKNFSNFEKSVLKYKGFYISRYLISERDSLLSKENQKSITYVTRDEALELANGYLNTNSTVSSLPSSYAYDTIFRLLDEGKLQYYEDVGKLSEWSTEYSSNAYYDYKEEDVSRGTNVSDRKRDVSLRKQNSSDAANEFTGFIFSSSVPVINIVFPSFASSIKKAMLFNSFSKSVFLPNSSFSNNQSNPLPFHMPLE